MPIVTQILNQMSGLSLCQRKVLAHLLGLWPCVRGRFNFVNLSRYSCYCERTLRRHFAMSFDWGAFNARWIALCVPADHHLILAYDHSFVSKSGHHTPGLAWFYNGCTGRTEKGLELALLAVLDLDRNTAYALHAKQTVRNKDNKDNKDNKEEGKDLDHLQESKAYWPTGVKHLAADGAFTRRPFVDGVCQLGVEFVGKLRSDANMRYLFTGIQSGRGRPKLYDGKVLWNAFQATRWHHEGELEKGVELYSATLYHISLKRRVKVALLHKSTSTSKGHKAQVLLFSTDLKLSGQEIMRMYRARFQIEFIFRDAKSGGGLTNCQSRHKEALHFHWNASFAALNLAKSEAPATTQSRFSWASVRQKHSNQHLLRFVSSKLDLNWNVIKSHPNFDLLENYGVIHP